MSIKDASCCRAPFHGSGLAHANCHPRKTSGHTVDTESMKIKTMLIGLLICEHQYAQQKADRLSNTASAIVLKVNTKKVHDLRKKTRVNEPVTITAKYLEDVEEFTYLDTRVILTGDYHHEICTTIRKANQPSANLNPLW